MQNWLRRVKSMKSINLNNETLNTYADVISDQYYDNVTRVFTSLYISWQMNYKHLGMRFAHEDLKYLVYQAEPRKDISIRVDIALQFTSSSNVTTANNNAFAVLILYETATADTYRCVGVRFQHITYTDRRCYFGVWDIKFDDRTYSTVSENAWTGDQLSSANPKNISIRCNFNYNPDSTYSSARVSIYAENTLKFGDYEFAGGQPLIDSITGEEYNFELFFDAWCYDSGSEYTQLNLYKVMWY